MPQRLSLSWVMVVDRANTWWWLRIRPPSTTWSSAHFVPVIRGRCCLPPVWYKSSPYRSRAVKDPRGVLADFGVSLPNETEIRVWDSTAETRFIVLPMRPSGTEGWSEEKLAELVTRDSMIGTSLPKTPDAK